MADAAGQTACRQCGRWCRTVSSILDRIAACLTQSRSLTIRSVLRASGVANRRLVNRIRAAASRIRTSGDARCRQVEAKILQFDTTTCNHVGYRCLSLRTEAAESQRQIGQAKHRQKAYEDGVIPFPEFVASSKEIFDAQVAVAAGAQSGNGTEEITTMSARRMPPSASPCAA